MNQRFFNRELAWLGFNGQVLEEALDPEVPLLERLRFLSIVWNNLDEFFMVRVARLKSKDAKDTAAQCPTGMTVSDQLEAISIQAQDLTRRTYRCAMDDVLPKVAESGIRFLSWEELSESERDSLSEVFHQEIFPVLTPRGVDRSEPFPILQNLSPHLGVLLQPKKGAKEPRLAIVEIPSVISRFLSASAERRHDYVLLEEVIRQHVVDLFPGQRILDTVVFRITRDSELDPDGDAQSLLTEIQEELHKRRKSNPVRLEVESRISTRFLELLKKRIDLGDPDLYLIPGPIDLSAFSALADLSGFDACRYEPYPPQPLVELAETDDLWSVIRHEDLLLHHPFDSFDPVVEMLKSAATDPQVLAIKQILYRTSRNSPVIAALAEAAHNGKQVCVLIELMARFDEQRNIEGAHLLEQAGAHVIWGVRGLKVHAKACMIVRREPQGIRRYLHLGTGNYNERTAKLYTDYGLLTADDSFGADVSALFNALTGYSDVPEFGHCVMAPYRLRDRLGFLIERETSRAGDGSQARITLKMNSLVDPQLIEKLYEASAAGVEVLCNVRGICCLRPGVPGLSENIRVISIIDRFLEHPRVYHFRNAGNDELYLSSADWMPRNLDRRVELFFPVYDPALKQKLLDNFEVYFSDNRSARELQPDGTYVRRCPAHGEPERRSQTLFHRAAVREQQEKRSRAPTQLTPRQSARS